MAPSAIPMTGLDSDSDFTPSVGLTTETIISTPIVSKPILPHDGPTLPTLDASTIRYNYTTSPREVPAHNAPVVFEMKTCTDHMITAQWTERSGWEAPELKPYGPLALMPTASVLHYATECFEGMKLYRGHDGQLRLFRPDLNCKRFLTSAQRIALPGFDPEEVLKLVVELCATDGAKWLPKERPGSFLYIRPTMIANDPTLGVQKPKEALLYIILAVFPSMDASPKGLRLLANEKDSVRAWPGGFGYAKVGANYGPTLTAQGEARKKNFDQILWLFGDECTVTEAGASNFFVIWRTREGKMQLITAPLHDRLILDGVTRRSVLDLARSRLVGGVKRGFAEEGAELPPLEIVERYFTMAEVAEAYEEGRLIESFAAGTAFFIAPVGLVSWRDLDIDVPIVEGGYTSLIKGWIGGIMYGKEARHEWGHIVEEAGVEL